MCAFCFPVAGIVIVGIAGIVSCILGKVSYSSVMLPTLVFFFSNKKLLNSFFFSIIEFTSVKSFFYSFLSTALAFC